jgi:hypothetical protein
MANPEHLLMLQRGANPERRGQRLSRERAFWAYMPVLPPELTAAICALRHLRSGCLRRDCLARYRHLPAPRLL